MYYGQHIPIYWKGGHSCNTSFIEEKFVGDLLCTCAYKVMVIISCCSLVRCFVNIRTVQFGVQYQYFKYIPIYTWLHEMPNPVFEETIIPRHLDLFCRKDGRIIINFSINRWLKNTILNKINIGTYFKTNNKCKCIGYMIFAS